MPTVPSGAMGVQAENSNERLFNIAVLIVGVVLSRIGVFNVEWLTPINIPPQARNIDSTGSSQHP